MATVHAATIRSDVGSRKRSSGLTRAGGAIGVLKGFATIAGSAVFLVAAARGIKAPAADQPAQAYDSLHALLPSLLPAFLLVSVASVLAFVFVRSLDERLGTRSPVLSPIAALCGYAALALLTLNFVSFVYVLESIAAGSARSTVEAALPALFFVSGVAGLAGSLFLGAWLALVSWIAARRGGLPTWIAYFGFLAAAAAIAGTNLGLKGFPSLLPNLWLIVVGVLLWLRPQPE